MMRLRYPIIIFFVGIVVVVGWLWYRGSPYQERVNSPCGDYYLQKYSTFTFSRISMSAVGGGSDSIDGFIRVFDSDDHLVYEKFNTFIRDISIVWDDTEMFILGCGGDPLIVPLPYSRVKKESEDVKP